MKVRLAVPDEAPALWIIRNQAIRNGCRESYAAAVLEADAGYDAGRVSPCGARQPFCR